MLNIIDYLDQSCTDINIAVPLLIQKVGSVFPYLPLFSGTENIYDGFSTVSALIGYT
jgi:hypothetical protein